MSQTGFRLFYGYLVVYAGLFFFGLGCLIWSGMAVLLFPLLSEKQGKAVGRSVTTYGFRFYLWCLTLTGCFRFDLRGLDALRDAGPLIIAPNHPCLLDAVMVLSRLPDVACVMKANLIDNPLFGASARLARYIRNDSFFGAPKEAVKTLQAGSQLLLFPEGTRTTRLPVNRLKGGAALVSKRSAAPIQTVLIETDTPFLSKGWPLLRIPQLPITFRVRLGRRFLPRENLRETLAELEAYYASELSRRKEAGAVGSVLAQPQNFG